MGSETKLKACPFCGGEAVYEHVETGRWSVGCTDKDGAEVCMGYQSLTSFARKCEAAAAWNTRALSSRPADMREALEEAAKVADRFAKEANDLYMAGAGNEAGQDRNAARYHTACNIAAAIRVLTDGEKSGG